mgnify:CR=1 FL=1
MTGWIKLHRGWHDSDLFKDSAYCERSAWLWLISNAAWKDTVRRGSRGQVIPIKRGQLHVSLRALAAVFNWSKNRVDRFLNALETGTMVERETGQSGCILTICNYEKYQSEDGAIRDTNGTRTGTQAGHKRDTQEEGKEIKEDKKGSASAKNHQLPVGWKPDAFGPKTKCGKIIDNWHPEFLEIQIEKFRANHSAKGSMFKDWQQAWKTWVLNSLQFSPVEKKQPRVPL